jgi:hypothetical protein
MSYPGTLWFTRPIEKGIVQSTKTFNTHFYERSIMQKMITLCLITCALIASNTMVGMLFQRHLTTRLHKHLQLKKYHPSKVTTNPFDQETRMHFAEMHEKEEKLLDEKTNQLLNKTTNYQTQAPTIQKNSKHDDGSNEFINHQCGRKYSMLGHHSSKDE